MGISSSLHGGSDNLSGFLYREHWEMVERGSGGAVSLSLWELCEGNLGEGFPCWGPWWIGTKGSGDRHLSQQGPPW